MSSDSGTRDPMSTDKVTIEAGAWELSETKAEQG